MSLYMVLSIYLSFCSDHSILGGSSVLHAPRAVRQTRKTHAGGRVAEAAHSAHPGKMREFWCFSSPPVNCLPMVLSLLSCFSLYGSPCSDCAAPHVPLRHHPSFDRATRPRAPRRSAGPHGGGAGSTDGREAPPGAPQARGAGRPQAYQAQRRRRREGAQVHLGLDILLGHLDLRRLAHPAGPGRGGAGTPNAPVLLRARSAARLPAPLPAPA